jgi:hypothetical protein
MSGIGTWLFQLLLLIVATFAFMVLFQYGTADFGQHAKAEWNWVKGFVTGNAQDSSNPH